jgi:hypothetical protein
MGGCLSTLCAPAETPPKSEDQQKLEINQNGKTASARGTAGKENPAFTDGDTPKVQVNGSTINF